MASRKEEKERRRQERLTWERQQQEQARRRRMYGIGAGGVLVVAAVAAVIIAVAAGGGGNATNGVGAQKLDVKDADPPAQKVTDLTAAAKAANCSLSNPPIEGRTHTTKPVKYHTNPPSSGNHNPIPADDGAYARSPSIGHVVHSLEHGRIEIQYKKTISEKRLAELKGLFDQDPYHMLLLPNITHMPYELAAVAWGHIAGCKRLTNATFDVVRAFTQRYRDKGPEFIP
jgi:Protein of unknown function (DUF3105)